MKLFANTQPEPSSTAKAGDPQLPEGFDAQDSVFFVPDRLRPHYTRGTARLTADIEDAARHIAYAEAGSKARQEFGVAKQGGYVRNPAQYWDRMGEIAKQLMTEEYDSLVERALHARRLRSAHESYEQQAKTEKQSRIAKKRGTCPVCGQYDVKKNGTVTVRQLNQSLASATYGHSHPSIRSCASCHVVAVGEHEAMLAAEATTNFKHPTRRDAVRVVLGVN